MWRVCNSCSHISSRQGSFATHWAQTHDLRHAKRDHYQLRQRKASYLLRQVACYIPKEWVSQVHTRYIGYACDSNLDVTLVLIIFDMIQSKYPLVPISTCSSSQKKQNAFIKGWRWWSRWRRGIDCCRRNGCRELCMVLVVLSPHVLLFTGLCGIVSYTDIMRIMKIKNDLHILILLNRASMQYTVRCSFNGRWILHVEPWNVSFTNCTSWRGGCMVTCDVNCRNNSLYEY